MKKIFWIFIFALCITGTSVHAQDYELKKGKYETGSYAGVNEEDYNYYKIVANSNGYIAITAKTSDKSNLLIDICNDKREVIASEVSIKNKNTVLHNCKKGKVYYIRVKGEEGVTYKISYTIQNLNHLKYAKKYNYTFTNAVLTQQNGFQIPIKTKYSGILQFMCETDNVLKIRYYQGKRKAVSSHKEIKKKSLTGIGVKAGKTYNIKIYNPDNTITGTTTIKDMKYQIDAVTAAGNTSMARAKTLYQNKSVRTLVPAGSKNTMWYKLKITQKQKLTITLESQMMQNNGKNLQLYICDAKGKKLNTSPIIINGEASCSYKKKYIMKYPKTVFGTTAEFPTGTYYIKVESKTKTSSGAIEIKWN